MQPDLSQRSALVFGGTGAVGSAVVRALAGRGIGGAFTYLDNDERARGLAAELGFRALRCDLASAGAVRDLLATLDPAPDVVIHCAAIAGPGGLAELDDPIWDRLMAVNARPALLAAEHLAGRGGDLVVVGALDRTQSLPLPVGFAATQGALSAMVMALGHELGPRGVRANMVALGPMGGGMSESLGAESRRDYRKFSALRREGKPEEAARTIVWLALENRYVQGKVIPVNGGI